MSISTGPTERQIDFAMQIAETIGEDLPEEYTRDAYHDFIDAHIDEFYEVQDSIRYSQRDVLFTLGHSYGLSEGFNGDIRLNINPGGG